MIRNIDFKERDGHNEISFCFYGQVPLSEEQRTQFEDLLKEYAATYFTGGTYTVEGESVVELSVPKGFDWKRTYKLLDPDPEIIDGTLELSCSGKPIPAGFHYKVLVKITGYLSNDFFKTVKEKASSLDEVLKYGNILL